MAREQLIHDDEWRHHAGDCPDCHEVLAVAVWMTKLADSTVISSALPAASYLLFTAQIQKRLLATTRIMLPFYTMTVVSVVLLTVMLIGLVREKTRVASIMVDAIGILASSVGVMTFAAMIIAIVYTVTVYLGNRARTSGRH